MEDVQKAPEHKRAKFNIVPILTLLAIFYIGFLLYQAVYFNYQTNQQIRSLKNDLKQIDQEKAQIESLIAYYKTSTFQELEARKKLGMKAPGEKVVQVNVEETATSQTAPESETRTQNKKPNPQAWLDFLLGREN